MTIQIAALWAIGYTFGVVVAGSRYILREVRFHHEINRLTAEATRRHLLAIQAKREAREHPLSDTARYGYTLPLPPGTWPAYPERPATTVEIKSAYETEVAKLRTSIERVAERLGIALSEMFSDEPVSSDGVEHFEA